MTTRLLAYATRTSYPEDGRLELCIASDAPQLDIEYFRLSENLPYSSDPFEKVPGVKDAVSVKNHPDPFDAAERGCGWPVAVARLLSQGQFPHGFYQARLCEANSSTVLARVEFVVRPKAPGVSKVLCVWPFATKCAYSTYGFQEFTPPPTPKEPKPPGDLGGDTYGYGYGGDWGQDLFRRRRVSFQRPRFGLDSSWDPGQVTQFGRALFGDISSFDGSTYCENRIYRWIRAYVDSTAETCSNLDLLDVKFDLSGYNVLVFMGHDEYWSDDMRVRVQAFIDGGGNVVFLTGNTMWWRVEFETVGDHTMMLCPKAALEDPRARLDQFCTSPSNDPESAIVGGSYRFGALNTSTGTVLGHEVDELASAYVVQDSSDWVFENAGLADGNRFGATGAVNSGPSIKNAGTSFATSVLYWETDSCEVDVNGKPTGRDGTPLNFKILARQTLDGSVSPHWAQQTGSATMGYYWKQVTVQGQTYYPIVFSSGTAGWGQRLLMGAQISERDVAVEQITTNILTRLKARQIVPPNGKTYAVRTNKLPTSQWEEVPTSPAPITESAAAIAGHAAGLLYAAVPGDPGRLYRRAPTFDDVAGQGADPWEDDGELRDAQAQPIPGPIRGLYAVFTSEPALFLASGTRLYSRSTKKEYWKSEADLPPGTFALAGYPHRFVLAGIAQALHVRAGTTFQRVSDAPGIVAMTSMSDKLIGLTEGNRLVSREPMPHVDTRWVDWGAGPPNVAPADVRGLAAYYGRLFLLTNKGKLLWRAIHADGTGAIRVGKLLFYNESSGHVAIGTFLPDGEYVHEKEMTFSGGPWLFAAARLEHQIRPPPMVSVTTPVAALLRYNYAAGKYVSSTVDPDGTITDRWASSAMAAGYGVLVRVGLSRLLFLNTAKRSGIVCTMLLSGELAEIRDPGQFGMWTDVYSTNDDYALLFYNRNTGDAYTAYWDTALNVFRPIGAGTVNPKLPTNRTFVPVGHSMLFGLTRTGNAGAGSLYTLDRSTPLTLLNSFTSNPFFSNRPWTSIVGGSNGLIAFYYAIDMSMGPPVDPFDRGKAMVLRAGRFLTGGFRAGNIAAYDANNNPFHKLVDYKYRDQFHGWTAVVSI